MINELSDSYPIKMICQAVGLSHSTYYYDSQEKDEHEVKAAIEEIALMWPTYGYRRIAVQFWRDKGLIINDKRVRRLMREMGLKARIKHKKKHTTNSEHAFPRYPNLVTDLKVVRPEQVWVADITYIRLLKDFVYLAIIMDVFTRSIRGWHLGLNIDQELTLTALKRALNKHIPDIHHSDQGLQYAATSYVTLLDTHEISISMAEVGQAWQNGYAERVIRTIKEEEVDLSDYQDYDDAYSQIGQFLDEVYMYKRIHSSLGYLTPAEFESQWLAQQH